jgi:uncharacterized membrane protein YphA (DoxX/SURF4 family)
MTRSRLAVQAFVVLMPGVVAGWAAWQLGFATLEESLVRHIGGPAAALVLWAAHGVALIAGYVLALKVGGRFVRACSSSQAAPGR